MLIRRAARGWLIPAAVVLPLWLLIGWGVFAGAAFGSLWVVLFGGPAFFVAELVAALLVRLRPSVRAERAASWWDVAGLAIWHLAVIATGFFPAAFFGIAVVVAVLASIAVLWSSAWQLWREVRPSAVLRRATEGALYIPAPVAEPAERPTPNGAEVIVVREKQAPPA